MLFEHDLSFDLVLLISLRIGRIYNLNDSFSLRPNEINKMAKDLSAKNYTQFSASAGNIVRHILGILFLPSIDYDLPKFPDAHRVSRAILWNRSISTAIGPSRIGDVITRVLQPMLPKGDFRDMVSVLSLASCGESQISPIDVEGWRSIPVWFQLYERIKFDERLAIIRRLSSCNIDSPRGLSR